MLYSKGYGLSKSIEIRIVDDGGTELDSTSNYGSSEFQLLVRPGTFVSVSFQNSNSVVGEAGGLTVEIESVHQV